jgi:hypothetical protein
VTLWRLNKVAATVVFCAVYATLPQLFRALDFPIDPLAVLRVGGMYTSGVLAH